MIRSIYMVIIITISFISGFSQSAEDRAREELTRLGLGDEEVRLRLEERGIDVNDIDIDNPSAVFELEKNLKDVIEEIEAEKAQSNVNGSEIESSTVLDTIGDDISAEESKILAKQGEEISNAIDDGATLEEAVSEELIDAQDSELPRAKTYGQEIFRSQNIKLYRQSEDVKPPTSYVLGVGDIIGVSIWGYSEEDLIFEVNGNGYIKPQGIPRIYLKGIRLGKAKELLQKRFANYYKFADNEFEVTLNYGRTINVNIVGEVYNYGTFNIPAINSAFNALVAAGGPNDLGSVRNIQLIRDGEKMELDIYKFLLEPAYETEFYLQEKDIIFVPLAEKTIKISGAVIRPHNYELKEGENLVSLLEYCGGLKPNASFKNIQIRRFENGEELILDVNLDVVLKLNKDVKLKNGDRINIKSIADSYENFVSISGAVDIPGEYAIKTNSTISELFEKIKLDKDAKTDRIYVKRLNTDKKTYKYIPVNLSNAIDAPSSDENIALKNNDELIIYTLGRYVESETVSISGAVRVPGVFPYSMNSSLTVKDLIEMAGGTKEFATDFAYIQRENKNLPNRFSYMRIDINKLNDFTDSSIHNPNVLAGDRIKIYSKLDFIESKDFTISGFAKNSGTFEFGEMLTFMDVYDMAGGDREYLADFAYVQRIEIDAPKEKQYIRVNLNENEMNSFKILPMDQIVFYSTEDYVDNKTFEVGGAVRKPGSYVYGQDIKLSDVITMSGGLTFKASRKRVDVYRLTFGDEKETTVLAANLILNEKNMPINGDFVLKPFDKIIVREAPSFEMMKKVSVNGEVKYPGDYFIISDNETLSSIIKRAGGVTEEAFASGIKLSRQYENLGLISIDGNKALYSRNSNQDVIMKEGDKIIVPKKNDLVTIMGETKARELYTDDVVNQRQIVIPFDGKKDAMYYIENFAGGVDDDGDKGGITVSYPNGRVKRAKRFLFWRKYPKVEKGATIVVPTKRSLLVKANEEPRKKIDWRGVIADTVAATTSILTLILLVQRIE